MRPGPPRSKGKTDINICLKQRSGGSWEEERGRRAQELSRGPDSVEALARWPSANVDGVCSSGSPGADAEMQLRFALVAGMGIELYTDYSGMDCAREAVETQVRAFQDKTHANLPPRLAYSRCCEVSPNQLDYLTRVSLETEDSKACVLQDIFWRLPTVAQTYIKAALPPGTATKAEKACAYTDISDWLDKNRGWIFAKDMMAPCKVHKRHCPVHRFGFWSAMQESVSKPELHEASMMNKYKLSFKDYEAANRMCDAMGYSASFRSPFLFLMTCTGGGESPPGSPRGLHTIVVNTCFRFRVTHLLPPPPGHIRCFPKECMTKGGRGGGGWGAAPPGRP